MFMYIKINLLPWSCIWSALIYKFPGTVFLNHPDPNKNQGYPAGQSTNSNFSCKSSKSETDSGNYTNT